MRISSQMRMASLINQYCTVHGLRSEQGQRLNGKECFVARSSEVGSNRLAVLFTDDVRSNPTTSAFMSLKADNLTPRYDVAIRPSPIAGSGLFATRRFKKGDIIMQEYPFMSLPFPEMPAAKIHIPGDGSPIRWEFLTDHTSPAMREVMRTLSTVGITEELRATVRRKVGEVLPSVREQLIRLGREDEAKSCDVCPIATEDVIRQSVNGIYSGDGFSNLHIVISRLNHSCNAANTAWYVSPASGRGPRYITASRDIEADEELLICYMQTTKLGADRRKSLSNYGVTCACCFCRPSSAFEGAINRARSAVEAFTTSIDEYDFKVKSSAHFDSLAKAADDAIADADGFFRNGYGTASCVGFDLLKNTMKNNHIIGLVRAVRFGAMCRSDAAKRLEDVFDQWLAGILSRASFGNKSHPAYLNAVEESKFKEEILRAL